ncbi:MAG: hypothetical protein LBP92_01395 [Deltaproteobacteria bacterium]|nr:hypothetical protein [Deltaproteobacteria bacterium]
MAERDALETENAAQDPKSLAGAAQKLDGAISLLDGIVSGTKSTDMPLAKRQAKRQRPWAITVPLPQAGDQCYGFDPIALSVYINTQYFFLFNRDDMSIQWGNIGCQSSSSLEVSTQWSAHC